VRRSPSPFGEQRFRFSRRGSGSFRKVALTLSRSNTPKIESACEDDPEKANVRRIQEALVSLEDFRAQQERQEEVLVSQTTREQEKSERDRPLLEALEKVNALTKRLEQRDATISQLRRQVTVDLLQLHADPAGAGEVKSKILAQKVSSESEVGRLTEELEVKAKILQDKDDALADVRKKLSNAAIAARKVRQEREKREMGWADMARVYEKEKREAASALLRERTLGERAREETSRVNGLLLEAHARQTGAEADIERLQEELQKSEDSHEQLRNQPAKDGFFWGKIVDNLQSELDSTKQSLEDASYGRAQLADKYERLVGELDSLVAKGVFDPHPQPSGEEAADSQGQEQSRMGVQLLSAMEVLGGMDDSDDSGDGVEAQTTRAKPRSRAGSRAGSPLSASSGRRSSAYSSPGKSGDNGGDMREWAKKVRKLTEKVNGLRKGIRLEAATKAAIKADLARHAELLTRTEAELREVNGQAQALVRTLASEEEKSMRLLRELEVLCSALL
jgi:hypothetical protein